MFLCGVFTSYDDLIIAFNKSSDAVNPRLGLTQGETEMLQGLNDAALSVSGAFQRTMKWAHSTHRMQAVVHHLLGKWLFFLYISLPPHNFSITHCVTQEVEILDTFLRTRLSWWDPLHTTVCRPSRTPIPHNRMQTYRNMQAYRMHTYRMQSIHHLDISLANWIMNDEEGPSFMIQFARE